VPPTWTTSTASGPHTIRSSISRLGDQVADALPDQLRVRGVQDDELGRVERQPQAEVANQLADRLQLRPGLGDLVVELRHPRVGDV
jgi:hypothetical protein